MLWNSIAARDLYAERKQYHTAFSHTTFWDYSRDIGSGTGQRLATLSCDTSSISSCHETSRQSFGSMSSRLLLSWSLEIHNIFIPSSWTTGSRVSSLSWATMTPPSKSHGPSCAVEPCERTTWPGFWLINSEMTNSVIEVGMIASSILGLYH